MPPIGVTRAASRAPVLLPVVLLATLLLLVSCSGGDGGEAARPSISPTRTPTATLSSPELPSVTASPTRTGRPDRPTPTRSAEQPTRSPEQPESPEQPAPTPTRSPIEPGSPDETLTEAGSALPTQNPAPTETQVPDSTQAEDEAQAEDEGVPTWVWWLLAALILGAAVAIPLVVRARRRNAWRRALAEATGELAWFARELLPGLRQVGSREQAAGGWTVGQPRVAAAEDHLTVLESTAPDDTGREQARALRDASRHARGRMQRLTGPERNDTWALDLDAIIADLEAVLRRGSTAS
jgi:hypothetical protein